MDLNQKTLRIDLFRSSLNGILEVGFNVFAILIAIRFLDASEGYKSILAAGSAIGFFLMPWTVRFAAKANLPITRFAGLLMLVCSLASVCCAQVQSIFYYTLYLVLAQVCLSQMPGLMIHVYSSNYKPGERGQNISWNFIFASIVGMLFSYFFGVFLDSNSSHYNFLFIGMGGTALLSAIALFLMPAPQVKSSITSASFVGGISFIFKDRLFGKMLIGWMLMGLGVIMTIPLRIEYMVGDGGIGMTNQQVAIIVVIYSFAGVLTSRIWGKLFDRIPFVPYRISLNLFLLTSILIFFSSSTFYGLILGSALAGVANGGASIAWSLWVTKLAPSGLEAEYMGAHVFMTGLRGFCAPFLGYMILGLLGFQGMTYFASSLIVLSVLIFMTEFRASRLAV